MAKPTEITLPTNEERLEDCWTDERDRSFNVEIHNLLDHAADEIDIVGPLASISRALAVVEEIRGKLIAERAYRQSAPR